jgi:hypothetical protein
MALGREILQDAGFGRTRLLSWQDSIQATAR